MIEAFEPNRPAIKKKANTAPFADGADSAQLDAAVPEKRPGRVEARRQRNEELEILAAFGGELLGRNSKPTRLRDDFRSDRDRGKVDLERHFRCCRHVSCVSAQPIAEIDH